MASLKKLISKLLGGGCSTAVFALTTKCNCRCVMCGMHRKPPETMELERAKKALKFFAENEFLMVYFTGGEPTLHPDILEIVGFANKLGLFTVLSTNGTLSEDLLQGLRKAGLNVLTVSLDHWRPEICEKIRGVKGIMQQQEHALRYAKAIGLKVYALVYINPYLVHEGVEKMVKYVDSYLDVPIGFCYPTASDVNTYELHGDFKEEDLNRKLKRSILKLIQLKKLGYRIVNTITYLEDILRLSAKPNFYCKGGENVFYVDWRGDVYPCFLKDKLFNLFEDEPRLLKDIECDECFTNCFREPSIIPQLFKSPKILFKESRYSLHIMDLVLQL